MVVSILLVTLAGAPAEVSLPFGPATYSADEDSSFVLSGAAAAPGNPFYISGPAGDREAWLASLREYRRQIREDLRGLRQVEIAFRGVRAWVRMRKEFAKAIDLAPGEPFRIDLEARWLEGNGQLVLALDHLDRSSDEWRGWSGAFSTLEIPRDGGWHRLRWEGRLPGFDRTGKWAKLIFGMDATHDPKPGKVSVRDFSLKVPERAEKAAGGLLRRAPASRALDRGIYEREDLRWASRAFICHFTFLYDLSFFDPGSGQFTLSKFLEEGAREFGGYDAMVLWHAYPRIGVDERNQFDFYRDMPDGLPGLRGLADEIHRRGIKVFIDYNPWDTGTRREGVPDEEAIATIVEAIGADGVFLDTMSAGGPRLREAVDRRRKGVVFEPEGSPPIEQLEICNASWAQGLPELGEPGILRLKWIEPRHLQHQIDRWSGSHRREVENAFFNGSGVLVWENIFGTWNPWSAPDRGALRRAAAILRKFHENFASDAWEPLVATAVPGVSASAWPLDGVTVWTILNRTGREVREPVLRLARRAGAAFFDLWSLERIEPEGSGDQVEIKVLLGPLGCVAEASGERIEELSAWLSREREEAGRAPQAREAPLTRSVIDPRPVEPSPRAPKDPPPPGMVLVPAGSVTMNLRHQRRECGCSPDPGTPPDRWREFLWGSPFDGSIEHHIGPVPLPAFFIDEHEVTNEEYARFLKESGWRPKRPENFLKHWGGAEPPETLRSHPVVYVDLDDARAYARWAGKRLPTEAEWHRAAQGDDGRAWPWGNEFDPARVNSTGKGTEPVASHPGGRSPFGCLDMAGNAWEWTESERSDGHTRFSIIRGGSWFQAKGSVWYVGGGPQPVTSHAKFIHLWPGLDRSSTIGFRCVKDAVQESATPVPLDRAHAHNDYMHLRPLLDALEQGFLSVEADVYLVDGRLLVAHNRWDVKPERTLESLYLDPLRERVRRNGGSVLPGSKRFTLLIDLKSEAEASYAALHRVLEGYKEMLAAFRQGRLEPGPVTVVVSGERPRAAMAAQELRYAFFDGRLSDLESGEPAAFIPWISESWWRRFKWGGEGPLPEEERRELRRIVERAHADGRRVRFWAIPAKPGFWKELWLEGVDLINSDDLAALAEFLRGMPR